MLLPEYTLSGSNRHVRDSLLLVWNFFDGHHYSIIVEVRDVEPEQLLLDIHTINRVSVGYYKVSQLLLPAFFGHPVIIFTE